MRASLAVHVNAVGGWHAVAAALEAGHATELLLASQRADARVDQLLRAAAAAGVPVRRVPPAELAALLPNVNHQGVAARLEAAAPLDEAGLDALLERAVDPLILVLDEVQDPHNLGACLRSAAAAGATAVVVPKKRAAGLTPAARKVAAGGAECVPLVRVTNLARCLRGLQAAGLWVVGADGAAPSALYDIDLKGPLALVLGGEGGGLRRLTADTCDALAAIPMSGGVASLNVSVAAGVCLFEARRQRKQP